MEFLNDYLVLVVVGICLCVGWVMKNLIPSDKVNRFIPVTMAVIGVLVNVWINRTFTPEILLGGMASGLASTGMHQAFTQFISKKEQNDESEVD